MRVAVEKLGLVREPHMRLNHDQMLAMLLLGSGAFCVPNYAEKLI
jgi:hypothetical protein